SLRMSMFTEELRSKPNTEFVSYILESGVWVFNVQHISAVIAGGTAQSSSYYPRSKARRGYAEVENQVRSVELSDMPQMLRSESSASSSRRSGSVASKGEVIVNGDSKRL